MATRLILIRHGETSWNLNKRYCGWKDVSLNPTGRQQAKMLAKRLKNERVDRIYCSDRKRAIQTAKIIFKQRKLEVLPELSEMHFGVFEGLTYKQIMERYPLIYKKWLKNPSCVRIPQGEALRDFKKRIGAALRKIISYNPHKNIAVVFHGGAIGVFINSILKEGSFWKYVPRSASLGIVEYKNGKHKVASLNDTKHLKPN